LLKLWPLLWFPRWPPPLWRPSWFLAAILKNRDGYISEIVPWLKGYNCAKFHDFLTNPTIYVLEAQDANGGHFEIQDGGPQRQNSAWLPYLKSISIYFYYKYAKFHALFTKWTIWRDTDIMGFFRKQLRNNAKSANFISIILIVCGE
jgi:hypothetical protein